MRITKQVFLLLLRKVQWHSALPCKKKKKKEDTKRSFCFVFFFFTASWLHIRADYVMIHSLALFFIPLAEGTEGQAYRYGLVLLFPISMPKKQCFTHRAKQSASETYETIKVCIYFFQMSWIMLQQTVSSCHNDPSQQRSPAREPLQLRHKLWASGLTEVELRWSSTRLG